MSRTDYQNIHSCVVLREPGMCSHEEMSMDPLWHFRKMIEHFQKKSASVAVPFGVSTIDESTAATKVHT